MDTTNNPHLTRARSENLSAAASALSKGVTGEK
jgi:hypothetical protein